MFPVCSHWEMSTLFGINRDFPYQVALSFDEIAMAGLPWLKERSFEWEVYVDLPAGAARYCFRTLTDATTFKQRFLKATRRRVVGGTN